MTFKSKPTRTKAFIDWSSQKLCKAQIQTHTLTHSYTRHTSIYTCQLANPSSLFLPQCAHIFLVAAPCSQKIFIFADFFSGGNTKEITPLFLPGLCQNNQCFPERDLWCDMRGGKAEGCRHSSRALVVDNKWGAVLGYVLQLSRLIIFDMHSGVYTVSSVKSSPAIEENRVKGAHTMQHVHTAHTEELGTEEPVAFPFSLPSPSFLRVPSLIHSTIGGVNTCQLTDFLFPVAYEKIMAAGLQRLLPHQYEFTMVFMQH